MKFVVICSKCGKIMMINSLLGAYCSCGRVIKKNVNVIKVEIVEGDHVHGK